MHIYIYIKYTFYLFYKNFIHFIYFIFSPRPYYPKSWLWSEDEAALYIQRYIRGWLVRKRTDIQEMRQFWKVIKNIEIYLRYNFLFYSNLCIILYLILIISIILHFNSLQDIAMKNLFDKKENDILQSQKFLSMDYLKFISVII